MKNLKYLEVRKDKLLYRRRVPRELASLFGKHTYYRQLQCKVGASDAEVVKAWTEAHESFEVMVQLSLTQFSDEVTEERLTRDAQHYLAFFKLSNGVLSELQKTYRIDPWDAEPVAFGPLQERDDLHRLYLHDHPNSPFDDFEQTHPPTLRQQIAQKAWEIAVSNTARVKPKRLISECWDIYNETRDQGPYDIDTRKGRRVYASWERFRGFLGRDCLLEDVDSIHEAVDLMVESRLKEVKSASVERDWNVVSAVLNSAVKRDRLNVRFQKPQFAKTEKVDRPVFSQTDQLQIVRDIVANKYSKENGVLMLLALQAGMINSELQRLKSENVRLSQGVKIPHILVAGLTKTTDRLRTVPITVAANWLREAFDELNDQSGFAMGKSFHHASDSTISLGIVKAVDQYRVRDQKPYSCYSLRHAYKANAIAHNAGDRYLYIAGWKNKETAISDTYARDAMTQVEVLGGLQEVSKTINKHLLDIDHPKLTVVTKSS
jgi:hypothetical protein